MIEWSKKWLVPASKWYWKAPPRVKGMLVAILSLLLWVLCRPLYKVVQPSDLSIFFLFIGLGVLGITAYYKRHEKHIKLYAWFALFIKHGFAFLATFYLFSGVVVYFIRDGSVFLLLVGAVFEALAFVASVFFKRIAP